MAARHNVESLGRALDIHKTNGVLARWSPPCAGRPKWLLYFGAENAVPEPLTTPQVSGFCMGATEATRAFTGKQAWNLAHERPGPSTGEMGPF